MNDKKQRRKPVMHYLVKDTEFEKILKFLQQVKAIHKNDTSRLRRFIEAVCYVCRSGCQWRLLPTYYGDWRAVHKRFKEWCNRGVWKKLFESQQIDPDMEWVMIDSTIVRAHACAAGYGKDTQEQEALGRSKGGFTTKIHALVDALGNPIKFLLTPGQRHDITQAKELTAAVVDIPVLGDKSYDVDHFVATLEAKECIPPRKNRKKPRSYDEYLYRERHAVECFFGKIKHFRRIFSRYDKIARSYLSFLYFAGALIWLR
jgi:transposase